LQTSGGWVYMPPNSDATPLPMLLVFDGRLYKDQMKLPEMLDYLIGKKYPPIAALMVDSVDRSELICKRIRQIHFNVVIPGFAPGIC
jgi:enterochelin esterase-like enzyme